MSKNQIGRSAMFLYIENVTAMLYGYAFWYILSRITTTDVIGISSSLISLATIFVTVASVGIPLGSQRFLGKLFAEGKIDEARTVVNASLFVILGGSVICSILILITSGWTLSNYDNTLIIIMVILVVSSAISTQFRYIIIASLETRKLVIVSIISSGIKLVFTIILVLEGANELGVLTGFTVAPLLSSVFFTFYVFSLTKGDKQNPIHEFIKTLKPLLKASVASWIPLLIDTVGTQMGTIIVLGIQGSAQAGIYFIAFQITVGISAVIWALESVTYPKLSAMSEGRKLFLWRVIKIGLIIVLPLSSSLIFYSNDVMQVFGYDYTGGAYPLQILLLSILPTTITVGVSILVYSYGNYRQVLMIGLGTALPRAMLYFILIPWYSGTGAALSFTIGSISGLIVSLIIARRENIILSWRDLGVIFIIPIALAFFLSNFVINIALGIIASVTFSYLILLKLSIIDRSDIENSVSVLPQ
ncbi:MAG TPA: oligosaccharide flippase family protein, partial [Nitrososphaeraceae archaeon]|nr:oligosaccharide flippase family protein [Nitrososphaeraceae archaeon]